jgi:hypothetical protein
MYTTGLTEEYERKLNEIIDPTQLWIEVHDKHKFEFAGELPSIVKQSWDYYKNVKKDIERTIKI